MTEDHSTTRPFPSGPNPDSTRAYEPGTGPLSPPPAAAPIPNAPDVPPAVAQLAQQRGLGPLVDVRREVTMGGALIKGGAMVAAGVLGMVVATAIGEGTSVFDAGYTILRFVVLFFFFLLVSGLIVAIRGLVVGSRAHFLHAGGLVSVRRGGPVAVAWPEIESLEALYNRRQQGSEGKVLGYRVHAGGRPVFAVPLAVVDGRDAFMDRIIEQVRAHGRPVR